MANVWDAIQKHQSEQKRVQENSAITKSKATVPSAKSASVPRTTPANEAITIVQVQSGKDYSQALMAHHDRGGQIAEEYRALRTSLLAQCSNDRFCYMLTSAEAGEGKTVSTLNLAMVMAERIDRQTVMIDCDLRKCSMAHMLKANATPGMADLLRGTMRIKEVIQPTAYRNLFFIPAGEAQTEEVAELIGRPEMEGIVSELRRDFDYALFDTPPISAVSDAGMLGSATGEALLVVRMNKTRKESVDKAVRLLRAADVNLAGVILTHQKYYIPDYLYLHS